MSYTPGPHEVSPADESGNVFIMAPHPEGGRQVLARVPTPIHDGARHHGERDANARLYAAAPDLLEALRTIAEYHHCADEKLCSICATCDPAIAKALVPNPL